MTRRFKDVIQFRISLNEIEPEIWRRIRVPATYTFWDLHVAIQDAMGWLDYHLHAFRVKAPLTGATDTIGIPDPDGFEDDDTLRGWDIDLTDYLSPSNPRAEYEYDFGDSWEHTVLLEDVLPREKSAKYPVCIEGARACPPEDCGGPPGYWKFLRAIRDVTHKEHESMRIWAGKQFDPTLFEKDAIKFDDPEKRWKVAFENR